MTLQTPSVQTAEPTLNSALTLPLIARIADFVLQSFSLMKKYCFERSVVEVLVESVVAMTIAAVIYFGHPVLLGMAVMWCLVMFGIAGYRLLSSRSQEEQDAEMTDTLQANEESSDAYMMELSEALV